MISVAIIGLGKFGTRVLEQLSELDADIIAIDKDRDLIEQYKDLVRESYITDAMNENTLRKIIPEDISCVIVDLGEPLEASILVTNILHKMGIKRIVAKALSNDHGEILTLVGATMVVHPDLDAAQRLVPLITSSSLFDFMQVSSEFAIAEVGVLPELEGKTILSSGFRQKYFLNIIAYRFKIEDDFQFIKNTDVKLSKEMHLLVAGTNKDIETYRRDKEKKTKRSSSKKTSLLAGFFKKNK
jgi:trk system potassium uptake protein TrkA